MVQSSLLWLTHEHKQRHIVETLRGNPGCMQTNKQVEIRYDDEG